MHLHATTNAYRDDGFEISFPSSSFRLPIQSPPSATASAVRVRTAVINPRSKLQSESAGARDSTFNSSIPRCSCCLLGGSVEIAFGSFADCAAILGLTRQCRARFAESVERFTDMILGHGRHRTELLFFGSKGACETTEAFLRIGHILCEPVKAMFACIGGMNFGITLR